MELKHLWKKFQKFVKLSFHNFIPKRKYERYLLHMSEFKKEKDRIQTTS